MDHPETRDPHVLLGLLRDEEARRKAEETKVLGQLATTRMHLRQLEELLHRVSEQEGMKRTTSASTGDYRSCCETSVGEHLRECDDPMQLAASLADETTKLSGRIGDMISALLPAVYTNSNHVCTCDRTARVEERQHAATQIPNPLDDVMVSEVSPLSVQCAPLSVAVSEESAQQDTLSPSFVSSAFTPKSCRHVDGSLVQATLYMCASAAAQTTPSQCAAKLKELQLQHQAVCAFAKALIAKVPSDVADSCARCEDVTASGFVCTSHSQLMQRVCVDMGGARKSFCVVFANALLSKHLDVVDVLDEPAALFSIGDRIVAIDDTPVSTFRELQHAVALATTSHQKVSVARDKSVFTVDL